MSSGSSERRVGDPPSASDDTSRRGAHTWSENRPHHEDISDDGVLPPLSDESDSSSDSFRAEESGDEPVLNVIPPPVLPRTRGRSDSLPSLESVSDSSQSYGESEDTMGESGLDESDYSEGEDGEPENMTEADILRERLMATIASSGRDLQFFVNTMFPITGGTNAYDNDSERAETLLSGLETVPDILLRRYEKLKKEAGITGDGCVICRDQFTVASADPEADEVIPQPSDEENIPAASTVLAFPCPGRHLFHHDCLSPWLARKTTCPTCRFDIDPDSLTLRRVSPRRVAEPGTETQPQASQEWHAPETVSLSEWLDDEEHFQKYGFRRERAAIVVARRSLPLMDAVISSARRNSRAYRLPAIPTVVPDDEESWTDEEDSPEAVVPTAELLMHLANTTQPAYPFLNALPGLRASASNSRSTPLPTNLQMQSAERRGQSQPPEHVVAQEDPAGPNNDLEDPQL